MYGESVYGDSQMFRVNLWKTFATWVIPETKEVKPANSMKRWRFLLTWKICQTYYHSLVSDRFHKVWSLPPFLGSKNKELWTDNPRLWIVSENACCQIELSPPTPENKNEKIHSELAKLNIKTVFYVSFTAYWDIST